MQVIFTKAEVLSNIAVTIALTTDLDFVTRADKTKTQQLQETVTHTFQKWVEDMSNVLEQKNSVTATVKYHVAPCGEESVVFEIKPEYVVKVHKIFIDNAPLLANAMTGLYGLILAFKSVIKSYEFIVSKLIKELDQIDAK